MRASAAEPPCDGEWLPEQSAVALKASCSLTVAVRFLNYLGLKEKNLGIRSHLLIFLDIVRFFGGRGE